MTVHDRLPIEEYRPDPLSPQRRRARRWAAWWVVAYLAAAFIVIDLNPRIEAILFDFGVEMPLVARLMFDLSHVVAAFGAVPYPLRWIAAACLLIATLLLYRKLPPTETRLRLFIVLTLAAFVFSAVDVLLIGLLFLQLLATAAGM